MSSTAPPTTSQMRSVDAQRVEKAISLISPKWTTWSAQTLAQQGSPMRVRDVAARLPFLREQFVGKRLAQMHAGGLVTRPDDQFGAPYQLSEFGESLSPVYKALSNWSQTNLSLDMMADAERIEDALQRLHHRHSTNVIHILDEGGPMRFGHIAEQAGLDTSRARVRLRRLQSDGLVGRSGPLHGDPYVLTDAGRALGPVYSVIEHWSTPVGTRRNPSPTPPVETAIRTHAEVPLGAGGSLTAAALRRSTAAPTSLFSHAPQPQPQVPRAVTAQSYPTRGR